MGADALADVTPADMLQYVLELASDPRRREIGSETRRTIHGLVWTEVELWDRVSHLNRTRVAFLENDGHLLALAIDRGPIALTGPGFEAVLASLEVVADTPAAR